MSKEQFGPDSKIIWNDRKRWCGLPWSFTRYYLVENEGDWVKLFTSIGWLSIIQDEINLYRIYDISVVATFTNRLFKTGTVILHCNADNMKEIRLVRIKNPYKVRDILADLIEKERAKKGYRIGEYMMGTENR
ncbi:MAG: PH domain-containing protein [Clostridia bacterium]|nr:PH domain-containing protein [Clostridia bacterium]